MYKRQCLHGKVDRGSHECNGGESGEQQQRGDGAGFGNRGGGSFERGYYGYSNSSQHSADGDADGERGRDFRYLRIAAERCDAGREYERDERRVRD